MNYTQKLNDFNSRSKYECELEFLTSKLPTNKKILDYGCGTGYAVNCLRNRGRDVYGYDSIHHSPDFNYGSAIGKWHTVYFMHSIAHIEGIKEILKILNTKFIIIITPDKKWLDENHNKNYIPDDTVLKHYDGDLLINLIKNSGFKIVEHQVISKGERIYIKAKK